MQRYITVRERGCGSRPFNEEELVGDEARLARKEHRVDGRVSDTVATRLVPPPSLSSLPALLALPAPPALPAVAGSRAGAGRGGGTASTSASRGFLRLLLRLHTTQQSQFTSSQTS